MARLDQLSPGQAKFVLERIVSDKKVRSREIDKYLKEMDSEIESLEERLSMLRGSRSKASEETAPSRKPGRRKKAQSAKSSKKAAGKKTRTSRKATTPEAQKSRQLQGQYISLIKRFSGKERDKYKKMAKDKGREEAVTQMKKAVGQ